MPSNDCNNIPLLPPFFNRNRTPIIWKHGSNNNHLNKVYERPITTVATIPKVKKAHRSVTFSSTVKFQEHIHINDLSYEEIRDSWLDAVDAEAIREEAWDTVDWALNRKKKHRDHYNPDSDDGNQSSSSSPIDSQEYCERGLELYVNKSLDKIRKRGLECVMKAQAMARNRGQAPSPRMIAMLYERATRESLHLAQSWAVNDHKAAME